MPINYNNYPPNWKTEIRPDILKRANHKCEFCGVANYAVGFRGLDGAFWEETGDNYIPDDVINYAIDKHGKDKALRKIVLTIAHLDHDTKNNDYKNLKALCQKCHNNYDAPYRAKNRKATLKKKKNQYELNF